MEIIGDIVKNDIDTIILKLNLQRNKKKIFTIYDLLTKESLNLDINEPIPKFSTINNDGIPFEFSVSLNKKMNRSLRFLTEVGIPGSSMVSRINISCQRLNDILKYLNFHNSIQNINSVFQILFPSNPNDLASWQGGMWIGVGFFQNGDIGLKIYINNSVGDIRERWSKMINTLKCMNRSEYIETLSKVSILISKVAIPLGIAFDILPSGIRRIKFYFRTFKYDSNFFKSILNKLDLLYFQELVKDFSSNVLVEHKTYPDSSIVFSLEFPEETKKKVDLKIDICCHCVFSNDNIAKDICLKIADQFQLKKKSDYLSILSVLSKNNISNNKSQYHAFIGIGLEHNSEYRFNIYLKPYYSIPVKRKENNKQINSNKLLINNFSIKKNNSKNQKNVNGIFKTTMESIYKGINYILLHQSPSGQWLDFNLPVGPSDSWITPYIGLCLSKLQNTFHLQEIEKSIHIAKEWCLLSMKPNFGWGFNAFTDCDADSTAHAIHFLTSCGYKVPFKCYEFLLSFQNIDGGFATYKMNNPDDSWSKSHPDVTPIVINSLDTINESNFIQRIKSGLEYIITKQNRNGVWDSFWWNDYLYSTYFNLQILKKHGWDYQKQKCLKYLINRNTPNNSFNLSLYGNCLILLSKDIDLNFTFPLKLIHKIIKMQRKDGSWNCSPILRVTYNNCYDPWNHINSGELYADNRNLFTTSTVLNFLYNFIDLK